jgi:hypothetical protein
MPDPLTHVGLAYLGGRIARVRAAMPALLVGAIAPDVLTYVPGLGRLSHTPVVLALAAYAGAMLFHTRDRRVVFAALLVSTWFHLGLDTLQDHIAGGYLLLFPFSWREFEAHLIDPEATLLYLPWLLGAIGALELALYLRRRVVG